MQKASSFVSFIHSLVLHLQIIKMKLLMEESSQQEFRRSEKDHFFQTLIN